MFLCFMFYVSSCTVQYYFVLSTTAHVRLLHVNKRVSQSVSQSLQIPPYLTLPYLGRAQAKRMMTLLDWAKVT